MDLEQTLKSCHLCDPGQVVLVPLLVSSFLLSHDQLGNHKAAPASLLNQGLLNPSLPCPCSFSIALGSWECMVLVCAHSIPSDPWPHVA